jgi:hypothetical protein
MEPITIILIFVAFAGGAFLAYIYRPKQSTDETGLKLILQQMNLVFILNFILKQKNKIKSIRFKIKGIYPGKKFADDVCLSDLRVIKGCF